MTDKKFEFNNRLRAMAVEAGLPQPGDEEMPAFVTGYRKNYPFPYDTLESLVAAGDYNPEPESVSVLVASHFYDAGSGFIFRKFEDILQRQGITYTLEYEGHHIAVTVMYPSED
jgi:hypothetical protein